MNTSIQGNYVKLIAFFLVAAILVAAFGFASDGWWEEETNDDNGKVDTDSNKTENDKNSNKQPEDEPKEPEIYIPEFTNALTGLETTEDSARKRHYAFVIDPDSPIYGISQSDIISELPIEDGSTRLLAFTNELEGLSKIGSLTATRNYISNIAKFFNSAIVFKKNDSNLSYESCNLLGSMFDMSIHTGYFYTEYTKFTYTNGDLVSAGLYNANINTTINTTSPLPYQFTEFGKEITLDSSANSLLLPLTDSSETEFYYSPQTKKYTYYKNGSAKKDMLSDTAICFSNIFVLFADSVTYETADNTEMIMNTIGNGTGYYISGGAYKAIRWESDVSGSLKLYDETGSLLTVNRGNSYIAFIKASRADKIKFS